MSGQFVSMKNCEAVFIREVPVSSAQGWRQHLINAVSSGRRISSMFAMPHGAELKIISILADDLAGKFEVSSCVTPGSIESVTPSVPQAHMFEREMAEQYGLNVEGHPWLKPVRFHSPHNATAAKAPSIGVADFYKIEGEQVHEVAVGPVHAGVIEPGHFRFQCHGENVFHLEISLGYQHRGVEKALIGGPDKLSLNRMETAAGDTTIGHATAYCQILESLGEIHISDSVQRVRAVALEIERLANHAGDLGMLAQDVGYLPTSSFCGRLRGDLLNLSQEICGNRLGRGLLIPGGTRFGIDNEMAEGIRRKLLAAMKDLAGACGLLWGKPSVLARFENTGVITKEDCVNLGVVGPAARAAGVGIDVRSDFPFGEYTVTRMKKSLWKTGDVMGRARVRWREIENSVEFIISLLGFGSAVDASAKAPKPRGGMIAVSMVEGWRGEICHTAVTNDDGTFSRYKIVDPSFHNWTALAMSLRGEGISDFPICNKSFNLSYCGFDL